MIEDKVDKKDWIIQVAEKLFAELGYDAASTRLIAQEAGVNMAMLNYYFGGKEGLYLAVFEKRIGEQKLRLQSLNSEEISSFEKLDKIIDGYADKIMDNTGFHKIIYREMSLSQRSTVTDRIISLLSENALEVRKILLDGIANGSFAEVDVDLLIASMFGTKMYLVNASQMASFLMGKDITDPLVIEKELIPRIKNHMKQMFKAYLTKP
ncbi:TetR/AcrR family transcriptional regulator [Pelobium sp.]|nr:TetR/AcrR family transcriptional regulator [Pelobium sp.]MDA9555697.1 TetR/AcrR family transcriptional regulator [Pelobium sp.]